MRIGVFGGSFDPIHLGHLLMAEFCREHCQLDELRLVPAAVPPHKQNQGRAADGHRLEMLRLAVCGNENLSVWDVELQRGGVSYTVDTLEDLRAERPDGELFFMMGADSLYDLPDWKQPQRICELAMLAVANRPDHAPVKFDVLRDFVSAERMRAFEHYVVPMPQMDISSSEIRRRVAGGQTIRYQTPRAVEEYIRTHNLYGTGDGRQGSGEAALG